MEPIENPWKKDVDKAIEAELMDDVYDEGGTLIASIVKERGEKYGDPKLHFSCITRMEKEWRERRATGSGGLTPIQEEALAHGVHMILDKLVRAAESPKYLDNWDDIQGYAKCIRDDIMK